MLRCMAASIWKAFWRDFGSDHPCDKGRARVPLSALPARKQLGASAVSVATALILLSLPSAALAMIPASRIAGEAMSLSGLSAPPSPVIRVQAGLGELRVSDVSGAPGEPILLKIELLGAGDAEQLFILRGIPKGVKLTPGGSVGNFWAVNSKVISSLTLTAPLDYTGSFKVSISRTQDTAASAQFASFTVTIAPQAVPETVSAAATQVAKAAKTIRQPDPNEQMLMARGTTLFKGGDVSAARGIFEYLAAQGSPAAAIAMGETYDPVILEKLVIRGLEANADKAREWYRQAESLGSDEAGGRLNALARR